MSCAVNPAYLAWLDKLTRNPGVMGGQACFPGTRLTVTHIAQLQLCGETEADILADYPYLTRDDLMFARAFDAQRSNELTYIRIPHEVLMQWLAGDRKDFDYVTPRGNVVRLRYEFIGNVGHICLNINPGD